MVIAAKCAETQFATEWVLCDFVSRVLKKHARLDLPVSEKFETRLGLL